MIPMTSSTPNDVPDQVGGGVKEEPERCMICSSELNIFTRGNQSPEEFQVLKKIFCGIFDIAPKERARRGFINDKSHPFCIRCARQINQIRVFRDEFRTKIIDRNVKQREASVKPPTGPFTQIASAIIKKYSIGTDDEGGEEGAESADEIILGGLNSPSPSPRKNESFSEPRNENIYSKISRLPLNIEEVELGSSDEEEYNNSNSYSQGRNGSGDDFTMNYIPYGEEDGEDEDGDGEGGLEHTPVKVELTELDDNKPRRSELTRYSLRNINKRKKDDDFVTGDEDHEERESGVVERGQGPRGGKKLNGYPLEIGHTNPGAVLNYGIQRLYHCRHCNKAFSHRQNMYRHEKLHRGVGFDFAGSNYAQKGSNRVGGSSNSTARYIVSKSLNQMNRKKPQYPCDLCGDVFGSNWSLQHHIQQQHSDETPYKCRICQKPYASRQSMISHMATHDPRTYFSCPFCPDNGALGFSKRGDLNRHLARKHPGIPRSHLDSILDATRPKLPRREPFVDDDHINHINKFNNEPEEYQGQEEEIDEPIMPKLEPIDFDYDQEDYNSNSNSSFPNFNQGGGDYEDEGQNQEQNEAGSSAPSAKIIELWPQRKSLPHKCRICGKGFAFIQNKKRHEGFHGNPGSLVNSMLTTRGINIKDKIRKVIQTIPQRTDAPNKPIDLKRIKKRVNCKYCGKTLSDIWNLRNHVQAFHSSVMNYKCVHCSKPYASKDSLRKHERKHLMQNPPIYRCTPKLGCNIAFISWDEYVMHYEEEHPNERLPEEIRNSKSKSSMVKVSTDEILHETADDRNGDPSCDICGKVLKNWFMLQRHKKAIHGLRPFKCRYCPRRFGLASSRTNHEQIHIGKRTKSTPEAPDWITLNPRRDSTPPPTLPDVRIERSIKVRLERLENSPNLAPKIRQQLNTLGSSESSPGTSGNPSPQKGSVVQNIKRKRGWSDEGVPVRSMKGKPFRCPNCDPGHPGFISMSSLRVHFTRFPKHFAEDSVIEAMMANKGGEGGGEEAKNENLNEILPDLEFEEVEGEDEEEMQQTTIEEEEDDVDMEAMIPKVKVEEEEDAEPIDLDHVENTTNSRVREMGDLVIENIEDAETDEEEYWPAATTDHAKEGGGGGDGGWSEEETNEDGGQVME